MPLLLQVPLLFTTVYLLVISFSHLIIFLSSQRLLGAYDLRNLYLKAKRYNRWTDAEFELVLLRLLKDLLLVAVFVLQHSLMATKRWKELLANTFQITASERLLYNLATSLALTTLMNNWVSTPELLLWEVNTRDNFDLRLVFNVLHGVCWCLIILQCMVMDPLELVGIKQLLYYHEHKRPPMSYKSFELQKFYKHMRHSGATCLWIIMWVHPVMTADRLLLALLLTFYLKRRHRVTNVDYVFAKDYYLYGMQETRTYGLLLSTVLVHRARSGVLRLSYADILVRQLGDIMCGNLMLRAVMPVRGVRTLKLCGHSKPLYGITPHHSGSRPVCYKSVMRVLSQIRPLHSLQQFSYANVDYQRYLESLLEEHHHMTAVRSSGGSVDQGHFLFLETASGLVERLRTKYAELADLQSMASGDGEKELQALAKLEMEDTQQQIDELEEQLVEVLVGPAPADKNDIMLEVSAGVGGQEAMLFTAEMFNMYAGYASYKGWTFTPVDCEKSDLGGVRRASALITGIDVYKHLKLEAGVHRVQRVPKTEKSGRIHTSTMTVAVLPQPTQIDISVNPKDLHIDTFRSGGAGGQHVNTTESAVRITHKPTGVVAECQQERSQIRNKEVAMKTLLARLYQKQVQEQEAAIRSKRKVQVGSAGRSEKIRTYNYSQDRITDHRGPVTLYNVTAFLSGEELLDDLLETLMTEARLELLHALVAEFVENQKQQ
ncbi:hypothetical protein BaRGS_00022367 [Batillaria attramentaria]|uniref:Prokaryotic-type class I peptide chain release factors domain-containing protein n=1 Tax=Batillaria attramentaria TaxID=370345 RepID=A0ABD0KGS5_9CAEN